MVREYLKYKFAELWEDREFRRRFPDGKFHTIDRALKRAYWLKNPYRISKDYLKARGAEDIYQYGETPLRTMYKLAHATSLDREDHFVELGCGRGRNCFFIDHYFQPRVTGIEEVPLFVERARDIATRYSIRGPRFVVQDFMKADLSDATVIYLYGTCLPDDTIIELCKRIPKRARTISVSYPLSDYDSRFRVIKTMKAEYPWGVAEVYIESCDHSIRLGGL